MSLKDIRSECSDVAGLLQPYVDAELTEREQEPVAAHLEHCSGCRAAVSEHAWVRATLQGLERETAPQALRAKVLLGLDEVDHERAQEAAAQAPPSLGARIWSRVRDLGRGGLIMVPASAVAVGLFFMAREGVAPPETPAAPGFVGIGSSLLPPGPDPSRPKSDDDDILISAIAGLQPQVGFAVQVPPATDAPSDLQLVGATLDRSDSRTPAARLRYQLPGGLHLVDRQLPARAFAPRGATYDVSGRSYHLHDDAAGQAVLSFEIGGVAHILILEGPSHRPDHPAAVNPERADYELLLEFAARLGSR